MKPSLPVELWRYFLQFLSLKDLLQLDSSLLSSSHRPIYLHALSGLDLPCMRRRMSFYNPLMVQWLILRNVALREVCISTIRSDIKRLIQHNSTTINSVTISGNTMTGRYGFVFCLEKCHNLIKFDIKYCSSFSFTEVEQVLPSFPSLQIIDLDGCIRLRPHTITVLVQSCPYLQSINLSSLLFITDAEVQLIATSCHHLRSIDVSYTNITDLSIQTLLALDHQLSSSSHCMELIRFRRCIYVTIQSARNVFQRLIIPHLHGKVPSLQDHGVVMFTDVLGMGFPVDGFKELILQSSLLTCLIETMPPNKETVLSGDFTSTLTIMQEYFPQASHLLSLVATFLTLTIESGILPQLVGYIASDDLDAMATAVEMLPRFTSKIEYLYQMISADILTHLHRIPQILPQYTHHLPFLLSNLFNRLISPPLKDALTYVPTLLLLLDDPLMKDWEPCFTAIVNLIGLGEGVLDLLLAEGYLQQLFEIIARDPSMYLNEFDLSRNLLVYSTTSTLRQMLQMNLLSLLRQSGTLNICLTEALETSPTVLEHLLELNVISDLVAMRSEEIYQGLSCCVEVAAKTDQIRELTDQGIVRFFLSCLNQYVNTENTLKVLLVILRADHSTDSISMVRESELIMIKQLTGHQKASISQFAKELLSLINVC